MKWFVLLVVATSVAHAQQVVVEQPANSVIDAGPVNEGTTSVPMRIQLRNVGTSPALGVNIVVGSASWSVVATGGDLGVGNAQYWDVAVSSTVALPCPPSAFFDVHYRNAAGDDFMRTITLRCQTRRVPFHANVLNFEEVGPNTTTTRRMPVIHTGSAAAQIVALTSTNTAYKPELVGATLPLTVAPGATFAIDVRFEPTASLTQFDTTIGVTLATTSTYALAPAHGRTSDYFRFRRAWIPPRVPVGQTWHGIASFANYTSQSETLTNATISNAAFAIVGLSQGGTLAAHTELPVRVAITPSTPGSLSTNASFTFGTAAPITEGWDSEGIAPQLTVSTADATPSDGLLDFGDLAASSAPVVRKITVTNPTANGLSIECRVVTDAADGFTSPACPTFIAAGASFDVDVTFTPGPPNPITLDERRFGMFQVTELGTLGYSLGLTAVIPAYELVLSALSLDLADTVRFPATASEASITLTNRDVTPAPTPAATVEGAGFSLLASPTGTVAPLGTALYRVGFAPPGTGTFEGTLTIAGFAPIPLRGTGIVRPVESASELDFGDVAVGTTATLPLSIHNRGTMDFAISELVVDDPQFSVIAPALTVPAGGDVVVEIAYTPAAIAPNDAHLAIRFDADPEPQLSVALHGTGTQDGGGGCCSSTGGAGSIWLAVLVVIRLRRRASPRAARR